MMMPAVAKPHKRPTWRGVKAFSCLGHVCILFAMTVLLAGAATGEEAGIKYEGIGVVSYKITPETIIDKEIFPPNCTEDVYIVDNIMVSCRVPTPVDEIAVAEEKEGGYVDITSIAPQDLELADETVNLVPDDIIRQTNSIDIFLLDDYDMTASRELPISYFHFKRKVFLTLEIYGNGGLFLWSIVPTIPGMRKIENKKISLAKFSPDNVLSYKKDGKVIYEIYFMLLPQIPSKGSVHAVYNPQTSSFYLVDDQKDRIKRFFSRLISLYVGYP